MLLCLENLDLPFIRLDQLVELSSTWSGPMSIAVFAPAQVFSNTYLLGERFIEKKEKKLSFSFALTPTYVQ